MSDIFISYARPTAQAANSIAQALRAIGYDVWIDDELPAHRAYLEVIDERLRAAKAVVVVWSAQAVKSEWVQSEADKARTTQKLVQLSIDGAVPPMPFDRIQCADLQGWNGDNGAPGWRKVMASLAELVGRPPGAAPSAGAPPALPDKPSIAVLPLTNLSSDPQQTWFADGVVVEIVTALSRFASLFVIASRSSLTYRDAATHALPRIGRELGVRYLLEGSVRRSGDRVRIAVQLIEAADGAQIWAERFDGSLEDVFTLQDTVANAIAARIEPTILAAETRRAHARQTADLRAYDLYLRAFHIYQQRWDKETVQQATALLDQAIALDPEYALALAFACGCRADMILLGWSDDPEKDRRLAKDQRDRALRAGGDDPEVLAFVAVAGPTLGVDSVAAEAMAERALARNPGSALAWLASGILHVYGGKAQLGLEELETGLRLDPRSVFRGIYIDIMGIALMCLRRFEEAIAALREASDVLPAVAPDLLRFIAAAHAHLGDVAQARRVLEGAPPAVSLEGVLGQMTHEDRELILSGLALAEAKPRP